MGLLPIYGNYGENGSLKKNKTLALGILVGFSIPVLIPFIHFGIIAHLWDEFNFKVDRIGCSCSCWDTVFKGVYERGPAGYKHIYFNATSNTFKIWAVTVLFVLLTYEGAKRTIRLLISGSARFSMLVLLACSIYPHYYSYWAYFNYWNDDFYKQWNHQLYFSITELISTIAVIYLLDKNVTITARKALVISNIAMLHVLSSGFDQFIENVVRGNGMLHQVLRDIFFMAPDILHIALPLWELHNLAKVKRVPTVNFVSNYEFLASVTFVLLGWLVSMVI